MASGGFYNADSFARAGDPRAKILAVFPLFAGGFDGKKEGLKGRMCVKQKESTMQNFDYQNPVRIVFGRKTIAELAHLVPAGRRVLLTYGQGSIKKNGVYDQVRAALQGFAVVEFGGIEPNPRYETLMQAVALAREQRVDFLLAVGGGSVIDGTKFIAAAIPFAGGDPWDILAAQAPVTTAVPLGTVLTLPATGSEMNCFAVISRNDGHLKKAFANPRVYPQFSILDPETTFSLPPRQVANGIVDAFVHVMEQYCTFESSTPLQDRMAEAILVTLIEQARRELAMPNDYDVRANIMLCATNALNGWIGCGTPGDWATHMIGHELTALYGIDHAQSLAVVLPGVMTYERNRKAVKLRQFASRVWTINAGTSDQRIERGIQKTEEFFKLLGLGVRLSDYHIPETACEAVAERFAGMQHGLGEHRAIFDVDIVKILRARL